MNILLCAALKKTEQNKTTQTRVNNPSQCTDSHRSSSFYSVSRRRRFQSRILPNSSSGMVILYKTRKKKGKKEKTNSVVPEWRAPFSVSRPTGARRSGRAAEGHLFQKQKKNNKIQNHAPLRLASDGQRGEGSTPVGKP